MKKILTFNNIINKLNIFWAKQSCIILQPTDHEVGAATFHPMTFINAVNKKKFNAAYTQLSKRPSDIRHTKNSNRSILFHQYQVIMKPSPQNIQELYLKSLEIIGINKYNDISFIEDNWKSPSLGANGIGWEVRLNGIEITQFTYFQQMGDIECSPIMIEIAYGLERLAMHIQNKTSIHEIIIDSNTKHVTKYSDIFSEYEKELTIYLEKEINIKMLKTNFNNIEKDCKNLILKNLPIIAYEKIIELSHIFNLIEARCYVSISEKYNYISRIRTLSKEVAEKIKK